MPTLTTTELSAIVFVTYMVIKEAFGLVRGALRRNGKLEDAIASLAASEATQARILEHIAQGVDTTNISIARVEGKLNGRQNAAVQQKVSGTSGDVRFTSSAALPGSS